MPGLDVFSLVVDDAGTNWEKADDLVKDGGGGGEEDGVQISRRKLEAEGYFFFKKEEARLRVRKRHQAIG